MSTPKQNLRQKYRKVRANIANKSAKDAEICQKLHSHLKNQNYSQILIYVSKNDEVDTIKIIKHFLTANQNSKIIAVPKVVDDELEFYQIESLDDLTPGYFGILEPVSVGHKNSTSTIVSRQRIVAKSENLKSGLSQNISKSPQKITDFMSAVCIVPGICFNQKGYRIGYGKGFYDRFLAKHPIPTIGLCFRECLTDEDFQDELDMPVDKIITE